MKKYIALMVLSISALMMTSCGNPPETPPVVEDGGSSVEQNQDKSKEPVTDTEGVKEETSKVEKDVEIGIAPGMMAPDFTLLDREGKEVSLSDYKGKITFLNFWATTCKFCIDEMPDLEAFYNTHKDEDDVALLGVNMTKTWEKKSKDKLVDWLDGEGLTFPVVFDIDGDQAVQWSASSLPMTFVIDENGQSLGAIMGRTDIKTLEGILDQVRAAKQ